MIPGFYALGAAWLGLLVGPLVLFYFLKLKRPVLEVPSLVLWRQVIEDNRVNSPFQRFKRNILLLIQLALLVLLILAAMQPFLRGGASRRRRLPVLIDCSASMGARSEAGGPTRLQVAKEKAGGLIRGLLPDQELCLVSYSRTARTRCGFTDDRRVLRDALDGIEVEEVPSDIEDALRMTEALGRSTPFDEVLLLSDGNFPERIEFDLPFELKYERLPAAGQNFGITSLNARASDDGAWVVFCRIEGSRSPEARTSATVECVQDGKVVAREPLSLAGGDSQRMVFRVTGGRASFVKVRLVPDGFDALTCDNFAFLALPELRPLRVHVSPSLAAYSHALRAQKSVRLVSEDEAALPGASFDLVISDGAREQSVEARTSLYVGHVPGDVGELLDVGEGGTDVVDWRRDSPLLRHVELRDLLLLDRSRKREEVRESDFENLGYEILIHGREGPLLLEKREGERLLFHFLFHTDRSTLPYQVGFPILVYNLVQQARHEAGLSEARAARTGILPEMTLLPETTYRVLGPDGKARERKADNKGRLRGISAPKVGEYLLSAGEKDERRLGASVLSADETGLECVEGIQLSELSVQASAVPLRAERPLWAVIAFLAFWVLVFEWWYFHRRPGGYLR